MAKMKLLLCDDDPRRVDGWAHTLNGVAETARQFEIKPLLKSEFLDSMEELHRRRRDARLRKPLKINTTPFDSADLLVIDYDLIALDNETGEDVAYLARCYSHCGLIVMLNEVATNDFDLTLTDHPDSFADLNMGDAQLANPGLWGEPFEGFRPWYWPVVPHAVTKFEKRATLLKAALDLPVLDHLGLPREVIRALPRETREFLGRDQSPEATTFDKFVRLSGNGLARKDVSLGEEFTARIAAARIYKWLDTVVLPCQDLLVDAPHLTSRFPSLLIGSRNTLESWNAVCSVSSAPSHLGINDGLLEPFRFVSEEWLSRPAWYWPLVSNCDAIPEVTHPWSSEPIEFEFCEDLSRFVPASEARAFVADLPTPFVHRSVLDQRSKFGRDLINNTKGNPATDVSKVRYMPAVRFSL
jgi:hypothetical protein